MHWLTFRLSTIFCFGISVSITNILRSRIARSTYILNRYYYHIVSNRGFYHSLYEKVLFPASLSKQYVIKLLNFTNFIGEKWYSSIILMCISVSNIQYNQFQSKFFIRMVNLNMNEVIHWGFAFLQSGCVKLTVLLEGRTYILISLLKVPFSRK